MKGLKIKETYLLLLIVMGLISLSVYSTYALFSASSTINNVVSFTASLSTTSNIMEYELVTVPAGSVKIIEVTITNSYSSKLYYGAWYEIVSGDSSNINIGLYTEKDSTGSSGTISASGSTTLLVGIMNTGTSKAIINVGTVGSTTSSLGISSSRALLSTGWTDSITVTDSYLASYGTTTTSSVNLEYSTSGMTSITLNPGTYKLEVWGAQGGYYSSTYGAGGKGGYSYGTLTLSSAVNAYVYVGGQGSYVTNSDYLVDSDSNTSGGYNDGANATYYGGGGASDIRLVSDSLYARVIVAGGGGGAQGRASSSYAAAGGYGGGTTGGDGEYYNGSTSTTYNGKGGTQTAGGAAGTYSSYPASAGTFGAGGVAGEYTRTTYRGSGAGGGGWYGGGGGARRYAGGGGGSGYVYTSSTASDYPSGGLLSSTYYLTSAATVGGESSFTDFDGTTVTGHSGDGAARISGTANITTYSIPTISELTNLNVREGDSYSLTTGVSAVCPNTGASCTLVGPDTTNTSSLSSGTHTIYYTVTSAGGIKYKYPRTVTVIGSGCTVTSYNKIGSETEKCYVEGSDEGTVYYYAASGLITSGSGYVLSGTKYSYYSEGGSGSGTATNVFSCCSDSTSTVCAEDDLFLITSISDSGLYGYSIEITGLSC